MSRCLLDSFTVPLHSANDRHSPAVRTVQRDCHWGLTKRWEFPLVTCDHIAMGTRQSQSIFRPPITKGWCQPIWGHVSYPTDNPIATRLGLCSSLCVYRWRGINYRWFICAGTHSISICITRICVNTSTENNLRSRKVSKAWDGQLKYSYRFEIWQASWQQCCRGACQISGRSDYSKYKSRDAVRSYDKTSYRILKRGPVLGTFSITVSHIYVCTLH